MDETLQDILNKKKEEGFNLEELESKINNGLKILIVEDTLGEFYQADAILKITYGIKTKSENVFELDLFKEYILNNNYDFIILDYDLPPLNAIDYLKILKKENIKTPVIVSSNLIRKFDIASELSKYDVGLNKKEDMDLLPKKILTFLINEEIKKNY